MKTGKRKANNARTIIAANYPAQNLKPYEKTLINRCNAARGGNFNADDLKNAAYGQAASLAQSEYAYKCSALETLTAYLASQWGKLQLRHEQLEREREHLAQKREIAVNAELNEYNTISADNWFVRFVRFIAPMLGMLLIIGISTVLDYAINSSRVTIINNSRLSTVLLTKNDLLLSDLAVVAISLVNNLAPFIGGRAYQNKVRGKKAPVSTLVFIGVSIFIAFGVNAIIPAEMFSLPSATNMQKLMSLLPYGTSMLGFLLPILLAEEPKLTVDECDARLTDLNSKIGSVWGQMQSVNGEQRAAADRINTDFAAAQRAYFSAIDALFCRFTSNHTIYRPASAGSRSLPLSNTDFGSSVSSAPPLAPPPSDKL
jgi:hypothetical protein